jgi:hypothetical protein
LVVVLRADRDVAVLDVVALAHEQAHVAAAARHGHAGNKRKRAAAALRGGARRVRPPETPERPALAVSTSTGPELVAARLAAEETDLAAVNAVARVRADTDARAQLHRAATQAVVQRGARGHDYVAEVAPSPR